MARYRRLLDAVNAIGIGPGGLGGTVDVDAISFSLAGVARDGQLSTAAAVLSLLVAIAANAVLKTAFAFTTGGAAFGRVLLYAFLLMFSAAAVVTLALA